jgi:hypothetical protein
MEARPQGLILSYTNPILTMCSSYTTPAAESHIANPEFASTQDVQTRMIGRHGLDRAAETWTVDAEIDIRLSLYSTPKFCDGHLGRVLVSLYKDWYSIKLITRLIHRWHHNSATLLFLPVVPFQSKLSTRLGYIHLDFTR